MYKFFQPKNKDSIKCNTDCMIRSVCVVSYEDYDKVHEIIYKHGWRASRRNSKGKWEDQVIKTLKELGYGVIKHSFPAIKGQPRMTPRQFVEKYPEGRYIMRLARHVCGVVDGNYIDTWDCGHKCVYYVWEVV